MSCRPRLKIIRSFSWAGYGRTQQADFVTQTKTSYVLEIVGFGQNNVTKFTTLFLIQSTARIWALTFRMSTEPYPVVSELVLLRFRRTFSIKNDRNDFKRGDL